MTDVSRVRRVSELVRIAKAMPLGDFERLMKFAENLQVQRQGKRQRRYQQGCDRQQPVQELWRI